MQSNKSRVKEIVKKSKLSTLEELEDKFNLEYLIDFLRHCLGTTTKPYRNNIISLEYYSLLEIGLYTIRLDFS